jgi:hypothetical protein
MRQWLFILVISTLTACSSAHKAAGKNSTADIKELHFINEYILPNAIQFKNTVVGGLSGIDYDGKRDLYYLISDDPSSKGPARYYSARISVSEKGIDSVQIIDVVPYLIPKAKLIPILQKTVCILLTWKPCATMQKEMN